MSGSRNTTTDEAEHTRAEQGAAVGVAEGGWVPSGPRKAWRGEALLPGSCTPGGQGRGGACRSDPYRPPPDRLCHQTPRSSTQAEKATQVDTRPSDDGDLLPAVCLELIETCYVVLVAAGSIVPSG